MTFALRLIWIAALAAVIVGSPAPAQSGEVQRSARLKGGVKPDPGSCLLPS
jgi:hypothetical protein